jgi:hypothetical protein
MTNTTFVVLLFVKVAELCSAVLSNYFIAMFRRPKATETCLEDRLFTSTALCCVSVHCYRLRTLEITNSGNAFLCDALRLSKEYCCLEGSQASPACLSCKSNKQMKMRMEHWWNDTDRGNQNSLHFIEPEATLSVTCLLPEME